MKKIMALAVGLLVLGFAFASAQDQTQTKSQEQARIKAAGWNRQGQNKVQTKSEFRHRNRIAFVDENGDGINDLAKDADGDGIPNGQDPDWVKPADGTGYQEQYRKGAGGRGHGGRRQGRLCLPARPRRRRRRHPQRPGPRLGQARGRHRRQGPAQDRQGRVPDGRHGRRPRRRDRRLRRHRPQGHGPEKGPPLRSYRASLPPARKGGLSA
ncbi:MAG: hypothetical protein MZU95_13200 [Desulfomicrobium escambiense]|nr:hypothetical protein [Desulfomicrobium escambiense]